MTSDLTHAQHDPAHVLAPGLFRSLKKGDRRRSKLDVTYKHGRDEIEFKGPEPLGADDLRVLLGLVAMSGPEGVLLRPEPKTEVGHQLRLGLFDTPEVEDAEQDAMVVKGSYTRLAHEIGDDDGGRDLKAIKESIKRLFSVTVFVRRRGQETGFRLLSSYAADHGDGRLYVALNPRICEAIIGKRQHARVELSEFRELESDAARLIHQRLSGWVDPGRTRDVTVDVLVGYVWPEPASTATQRKRRTRVRDALEELQGVGWSVMEYKRGCFEVGRPDRRRSAPRNIGHAPG